MSREPAARLRQACAADIPALWRVRLAVRENRLSPGVITDEDVRREIEDTGRGWVIEVGGEAGGEVVAFAIGNASDGNVWGLFVAPGHQGMGHGSRLLEEMVAWLRAQGLRRLWLSTGSSTRARAFYEARGWRDCGPWGEREHRYELDLAGAPA